MSDDEQFNEDYAVALADAEGEVTSSGFWSLWYDMWRALAVQWVWPNSEICTKCGGMKLIEAECKKCPPVGKVACPMLGDLHKPQCNLCKGSLWIDEL